MNKPYDLLQAKPKLQLLQLQFIQFDYLQLQFVCITLLLFKDKYCKCYLGELGEDLADLLFLKVHCIKCKVVPQILLLVFESSAIGTI